MERTSFMDDILEEILGRAKQLYFNGTFQTQRRLKVLNMRQRNALEPHVKAISKKEKSVQTG